MLKVFTQFVNILRLQYQQILSCNVETYFMTNLLVLEESQVKQASLLGHHAANFWPKCLFQQETYGTAVSPSSNHTLHASNMEPAAES